MESVKGERYIIDEMDTLLNVIENYEVGKQLPNRDTLRQLTGLSDHCLRKLINELKDQGRTTYRQGLGSIWNG
jgi:DNA-binding GntR family transcriptional regulator